MSPFQSVHCNAGANYSKGLYLLIKRMMKRVVRPFWKWFQDLSCAFGRGLGRPSHYFLFIHEDLDCHDYPFIF